jgi:hypothetical protein
MKKILASKNIAPSQFLMFGRASKMFIFNDKFV